MLFNSIEFIFFFLPIALVGYYVLASLQHRAAAVWLIIVSLAFYGWWNPAFIILLVGSVILNFLLGRVLLFLADTPHRQNWILVVGVCANIGLLFYFKYLFPLLGFFKGVGLIDRDFGSIVLPLGISFFTFTQIGYLIDLKSEMMKERSLINYTLFVTFFPHLIAGPIMHHKEMMPQFAHPETYKFRVQNISIGLTLFVIGLAKKVLFADRIAPWAEAGFASPEHLGLFASWATVLSYSLQLYFDFSGYSDMAIGLAKMFGVRFPLNFNSPYKSLSVIEFWQSWHMTLTRYLNLYLYNPLALTIARRRAAKGLPVGRRGTSILSGFTELVLVPTTITIAIAGIWHGAGLQFLIFGLLHACYLSTNHAWRIFGPKMPNERSWVFSFITHTSSVLLTFIAVLIAQVFFRADNTADAFTIIFGLLGAHGIESLGWSLGQALPSGLGSVSLLINALHQLIASAKQPLVLAALFVIVWRMPNAHQIMGEFSPALAKPHPVKWRALAWRPSVVWALLTCGVFFGCMVMLQNTAKFLYFQF